MNVKDFRKVIKANVVLMIEGKKYQIEELVKFRVDDGTYYFKCYLKNGYVFAEDSENNIYQLLKHIKTSISQPFPKKLRFQNKDFTFLYDANATAEEVSSEKHFGKKQSEHFWDYKDDEENYLSLGINDWNGKRADCIGKIIKPEEVDLI